jgi:hypothetical protein
MKKLKPSMRSLGCLRPRRRSEGSQGFYGTEGYVCGKDLEGTIKLREKDL